MRRGLCRGAAGCAARRARPTGSLAGFPVPCRSSRCCPTGCWPTSSAPAVPGPAATARRRRHPARHAATWVAPLSAAVVLSGGPPEPQPCSSSPGLPRQRSPRPDPGPGDPRATRTAYCGAAVYVVPAVAAPSGPHRRPPHAVRHRSLPTCAGAALAVAPSTGRAGPGPLRRGRLRSGGWATAAEIDTSGPARVRLLLRMRPAEATVPLPGGTVATCAPFFPSCPRARPAPQRPSRATPGGGVPARKPSRSQDHPSGQGARPPVGREPLPGGVLVYTQRDRATLTMARTGKSTGWRSPADRLGLRRDRADGARGRPGLQRQPPHLHLPGRQHRQRRPRRARHRVASQRQAPRRPRPGTGRWLPDQLRRHGGCRLHRRRRRLDAGRHRRRRERHQPRGPRRRSAARRCAWTGSPARRGRPTRSPAANRRARYVQTYGHRNVQGLAERATAPCGRSSRAPTATTRSTGSSTAATTATTRCPATTSGSR